MIKIMKNLFENKITDLPAEDNKPQIDGRGNKKEKVLIISSGKEELSLRKIMEDKKMLKRFKDATIIPGHQTENREDIEGLEEVLISPRLQEDARQDFDNFKKEKNKQADRRAIKNIRRNIKLKKKNFF
jgi:hypothetical protein